MSSRDETLLTDHNPHPPVTLGSGGRERGRRVGNEGVKLSLGEGKLVLSFAFVSHYPTQF